MREIITICVGGAGVRIGAKFWELLCLEHGISPDGQPNPDFSGNAGDSRRSFFNEMESGKLVPRTIFVDVEPTSVDEIHTGPYKDLFNPEYFVSGREDGGCGSFARAYNVWNTINDDVMDRIEGLTQECDSCQGFLIIHSLGGGAGSGLTAHLMEELSIMYGKRTKLQFAIYPTPKLSTSVTAPYNAVLSTHYANDHSDCCFLLDNDAIYDIAQRNLGIPSPSYEDLNGLIAHAIADVTACLRFEGELNMDINEFQTTLVPYPRLRFPAISYVPIVSRENTTHSELNTLEITNALFDPANQLVRCDLLTGKYMSCCLLYCGDVTPRDVNAAIAQIKSRHDIPFVDWCPVGFKVGISHQPKASFPDDLMASAKRSVTMLSNTTATVGLFTALAYEFDLLYANRDFLDLYIDEGMDESKFNEAREDLAGLFRDYEEVGMD